MIRLYLRNYSDAECDVLYNVLSCIYHQLSKNSQPCKDFGSALDYLTGYIDCRADKKKGGVENCPHV